jgi:hypothetical protein
MICRKLLSMCGIVGYVGPKSTLDVLLGGLRRLEYRGYDSAGVSVIDPAEGRIRHAKKLAVSMPWSLRLRRIRCRFLTLVSATLAGNARRTN